MKRPSRIAEDFRAAAFIGIRRSDQGLRTACFINGKEVELSDLGVLIGGLKKVEEQVRAAFDELQETAQRQKRRRRKKPTGKPA